ncbi:hypothetical protein KAR91_61130 [Candidatus Pacearchaeota archaeon]|nr:hypothetical protein [Candidatus Pacearchaeota archaeon]
MIKKLPTKVEKALPIAETVVKAHQFTAKVFAEFGHSAAAAGISAAQASAAMAQLANIGAFSSQPKEHPLARAVREATEKED